MTEVEPTGATCPFCHRPVAAIPPPGRACPQCESEDAWDRWRRQGLVITESDIEQAVARRAGESAGAGFVRRSAELAPAALAICFAGVSSWFVFAQFRPLPIASLAEVLSAISGTGRVAALAGLASLATGSVALWRLRRGRLFRSGGLLAMASAGVLAGAAGVVTGGFNWYTAGCGFAWMHTVPPAIPGHLLSADPWVRSVMEATAIILAPDRDGDARGLAMGSGAVIGSAHGRTWIVTSSHVAMPYASSASFRRPADAHPVRVCLADGHDVEGRVVWTAQPPLDVAIVEVLLERPPRPVPVSRDVSSVRVGDSIRFVPNPLRRGWMSHAGAVTRTQRHVTTAGEYTLLFTTLPAQPGDSGAGMFDATGALVGLTTWGRESPGEPLGISLPADVLKSVLDDIIQGEARWADGSGGPR